MKKVLKIYQSEEENMLEEHGLLQYRVVEKHG